MRETILDLNFFRKKAAIVTSSVIRLHLSLKLGHQNNLIYLEYVLLPKQIFFRKKLILNSIHTTCDVGMRIYIVLNANTGKHANSVG